MKVIFLSGICSNFKLFMYAYQKINVKIQCTCTNVYTLYTMYIRFDLYYQTII